MNEQRIGVGVVGCGNIAGPYTATFSRTPDVDLVGVTDLDPARAAALAEERACAAFPSLEAMLADERVEVVVNLTIHHAHYEVTKRILEAGRHVYSEKPLAMQPRQARELVQLATEKGLRLGCSPFTWMGEAQQTAWKLVREGRLGTVRVAYAEVNWGRIESWHPAPAPFYEVGALWDVGVYPLTLLTAFFGPVRRVFAYGALLHPARVTKAGVPFRIETPDFVVATLELATGTLVRLTTNFYVTHHGKQQGIEFHGDLGSVHLASWQESDTTVEFAPFGEPYRPLPLIKEPDPFEWGFGAVELARALREGRPHRATGEQAAHIVDVLAAISTAIASQGPVEVQSGFPPPVPMGY
mgnify:CR=1 FL=1